MSRGWRVASAHFEVSAPSLQACPEADLPELAMCGRSNAGKSSLLNALAGQRGLARVSRTPGRTQLLNFFEMKLVCDDRPGAVRFRCVDLPGYGFASMASSIRKQVAPMVEGYLQNRSSLVGLALLVDARKGVSELDRDLLDFARGIEVPVLVLCTKADKLGASERGVLRKKIKADVGGGIREVVITSAARKTGIWGRGSVAEAIASLLADGAPREG